MHHTIAADDRSTWKVGYFCDDKTPVVTVESGDQVHYSNIPSHWGGRADDVFTLDDAMGLAGAGGSPHTVVGPVAVREASVGDVLEVRFDAIVAASPAINFCLPGELGLGSRPGDYPKGYIRRFEFEAGASRIALSPGVDVPLAPFPGIVGLQPAETGWSDTMAPGNFGGNIDLKYLTSGSRLFLPVQRAGALLYVGDIHAAQGDGEVNLTALEVGAVSLDLTVVRHPAKVGLRFPLAETAEHWIPLGFGADLEAAFQSAMEHTLWFLQAKLGLSADDAYCLASVAVDFHITQVVNGVKGVHSKIAKSLFVDSILDRMRSEVGDLSELAADTGAPKDSFVTRSQP